MNDIDSVFLYVYDEKLKDKLLAKGYDLIAMHLSGDVKTYVFLACKSMNFDGQDNLSYKFSNSLFV